jgi:hypothetical protein
MSNEKKHDKKTNGGTAETVSAADKASVTDAVFVETAESAEAPPATTALVTLSKDYKVPTVEELDALAVVAKEKFDALSTLLADSSLSTENKAKVQALIAQANPIKPGMEEMSTTWSVPRIVLCQPTTNDPKKPESARPGDIFTTSGQLLEKPFAFIPLNFNPENIKFKQGEKAPECSSPDAKVGSPYGVCAKCPHLPLGQQNGGRGKQVKTECQNQIVVAVLAADLSQVYLAQFAKTSRGAGSALVALAKAQPFPWKQSYLLSSTKETGDLGVYHIYKVEATGKDNSTEAQTIALAFHDLYDANRKKMLGEYYYRLSTSDQTAAAAEQGFASDDKLAQGMADHEPDLSGGAAAPGPSMKSSAKPM